jgi:hypothetical protein
MTPYLFTRETQSGGQVTGVGVMDDRGYLWIDDHRGLHPYPTGKLWTLSPIPADSALVAPLVTRVRDILQQRADGAAQIFVETEMAKIAAAEAAAAAAKEREDRRAAIGVGDYIMVSGHTLARIVSRDDKRTRVVRYTPHLNQWGPVRTLASSWTWEVATPEEIVANLHYKELAKARLADEVARLIEKEEIKREIRAAYDEATKGLMTRARWREAGYRVKKGSFPQYSERYKVPGFRSVYRYRNFFERNQVVPLRATVAAALSQIDGAL